MSFKITQRKKAALNMTAMIDVVFLLLIFFVMTFKIVAPEGDFNLKIPADTAQITTEMPLEPIRIGLTADANGDIVSIIFGDRNLGKNFAELRNRMVAVANQGAKQGEIQVELAPDDNLKYEYVIAAFTAVTGEVRDGQIVKICENVKFAAR